LELIVAAAGLVMIACIVWLHWRALKDGAIHDVLLLLTGISILSYVIARWDRAKVPVLGFVGGLLLGVVVTLFMR
jgi:hypothetical protein